MEEAGHHPSTSFISLVAALVAGGCKAQKCFPGCQSTSKYNCFQKEQMRVGQQRHPSGGAGPQKLVELALLMLSLEAAV